jgi:hypothetical protein
MWRAGFGRGFGPVVRQTAKRMNEYELQQLIFSVVKHHEVGQHLEADVSAAV